MVQVDLVTRSHMFIRFEDVLIGLSKRFYSFTCVNETLKISSGEAINYIQDKIEYEMTTKMIGFGDE